MGRALESLRRAGLAALDAALPSMCLACGERVHTERLDDCFLCEKCTTQIEFIELPICPVCGSPQRRDIEGRYCRNCPPRPHHFDFARSVVRYNDVAAELVRAFKYERLTTIGKWMANLMFIGARETLPFEPDMVTAVPLHFLRRTRRGFNQADRLAQRLCRLTGWRFEPRALARIRATPKQAFLSPKERERNVRDAFDVPRPGLVDGKSIMIIDDVFTTGSSVNECARMLRRAGAARVIIFTFARA